MGQLLQFGNGVETARRRPRLDERAAPVGRDQTDWNLQFALQFMAEEERAGRQAQRIVGFHFLPFHREILARQLFPAVRNHPRETDQIVRAFGAELVAVDVPPARIVRPHRHFHVGLAAAQPDFADQHVVDRNRLIISLDDQRAVLRARRQRRQFHHPLTIRIRLARHVLARKTNGNLLARLRRAPNGHCHVALQHDIIDEYRRANNLRQERQRQQTHQPQQFPRFHTFS